MIHGDRIEFKYGMEEPDSAKVEGRKMYKEFRVFAAYCKYRLLGRALFEVKETLLYLLWIAHLKVQMG